MRTTVTETDGESAEQGDSPSGVNGWLNRTVLGVGLTSALGDLAYETGTVVLPGFLATIGGSAAALGAIEGIADATASFVKLGSGHLSDRLGRRKPLVLLGYALTPVGQALFALANGSRARRQLVWAGHPRPAARRHTGRGVTPATRGRAFGFHRGADTLGAVAGPLLGVALLALFQGRIDGDAAAPYRWIFWLSVIPGVLSVVTFAWLVAEARRPASPALRFWRTVGSFPTTFRRFLLGVGVFGLGDFAPTLLILAATTQLTPEFGLARAAQIGGLLYVLRNVVYAAGAFPVGMLADRFGHRRILVGGYALGALVTLGVLCGFAFSLTRIPFWALLFTGAWVVIATQDALEATLTAELIPSHTWGTAFGVLGTVNGVGDLASSVLVGALWTGVSPVIGFGYAAVVMAVGAIVLAAQSPATSPPDTP